MKKNKPSSKKINWDSLKDKKIHKFITIGEFLSRLEETPNSILDYDIRYAIERLQDTCSNGTEKEAREARKILREALIPKGAIFRHKQSTAYRQWYSDPNVLIPAMAQLENRMRRTWKKHENSNPEVRIKKALEKLFVEPSLMEGTLEDVVEKLKALPRGKEGKAEYTRGRTNLAVACFMVAMNIRDVRVVTYRDFYKKIKNRYRPKPKEKLTDEKRFPGPYIDELTRMVVDKGGLYSAKFVYNQAYEIYKLSFFFDDLSL